MKKILLVVILIIINSPLPHAIGDDPSDEVGDGSSSLANQYQHDGMTNGPLDEELEITTVTSEPCGIAGEAEGRKLSTSDKKQEERWECKIKASDGFITFITSIYKFVFFISLVIGVLVIVFLGISMSISGILAEGEEAKTEAKQKIIEIIIGLLALALIPWILKTIAPFFFS